MQPFDSRRAQRIDDCLALICRNEPLFTPDVSRWEDTLRAQIGEGAFLVIGGAGSIGQAVVKELFKRGPRRLYVVDISENNMVELVRDLRSSLGYIDGDFRTFVLDCGSPEFDAFVRHEGPFDYVLNLSAMKHVRSERDPYTLMRMIQVNILNVDGTIAQAHRCGARKYFCVSTDKATNPVNMMGASKRIMELYLMRRSEELPISTARFANVAFSDGSLLCGFARRIAKQQPISAPFDVKRYFITLQESGELCLMSCLLGENRDIFFPKLSERLHLITFADIARRYLRSAGYEPVECATEDEARGKVDELPRNGKWPCYFFKSDTTGEKDFEEFTADTDVLDMDRFSSIGVIKNSPLQQVALLERFSTEVGRLLARGAWTKEELLSLFEQMLPEFNHREMNRNLDGRM
ncbi:MAG TPA: polysaccharide biosynthesis protein [Sedimentisphaerales bacterium]|nr:polysaccharide biosynthesis protein [Sedimentisphaerales bacterium]